MEKVYNLVERLQAEVQVLKHVNSAQKIALSRKDRKKKANKPVFDEDDIEPDGWYSPCKIA